MRWYLSYPHVEVYYPDPVGITTPESPPFPDITLLQIIDNEATVLIDLPIGEDIVALRTHMADGVLIIRYGNQSRSIPIFDDKQGEILRTEYHNDRVLIEIIKP